MICVVFTRRVVSESQMHVPTLAGRAGEAAATCPRPLTRRCARKWRKWSRDNALCAVAVRLAAPFRVYNDSHFNW